jgi:hypothetical protein
VPEIAIGTPNVVPTRRNFSLGERTPMVGTRLGLSGRFTVYRSSRRELAVVVNRHQPDMVRAEFPRDRFIIVTGDPDLTTRTRQSPQASRIMSFDQFLKRL